MGIGRSGKPVIVEGPRLNVKCEYLDIANCLCVLVDVKGERPSYEDDCQCTSCRIDLLDIRYNQHSVLTEKASMLLRQKD